MTLYHGGPQISGLPNLRVRVFSIFENKRFDASNVYHRDVAFSDSGWHEPSLVRAIPSK
jgi:hypothetical protein